MHSPGLGIEEARRLLGIPFQTTVEEDHADAMARGADCKHCPLYGHRRGPVMAELRPGSKLTIIGEAPGGQEVELHRPFVGPTGDILNASLVRGGLTRDDTTITNTLLCRPPEEMSMFLHRQKLKHELEVRRAHEEGREPPVAPKTPHECCAPRLQRDVEEAGSPVLLAVGAYALEATAKVVNVPFGAQRSRPGEPRINRLKRQIGAPVLLRDGRVVIASYHPAFAVRKGSRQYMPVVKQHLTRAARIAARGAKIDWQEPRYITSPDIDTVERVLADMRRRKVRVSVDIETDGINTRTCKLRCVGIGANLDGEEVVISVPFRRMDGKDHWSPEDKVRAAAAVMDVLNENELMGHNLAFDTSVLLRVGLLSDRRKQWHDSLLAHHDTDDNDLPHDLGFVTARYFESPQWKLDVDAKSIDGVDDDLLRRYNCRDVLAVLRLMPELEATIQRLGTAEQYTTDRALAPIFRDMGELGLVVDRHERLRLLKSLTADSHVRRATLREITGRKDFNPNATEQVRWFLYGPQSRGGCGLIPPYNTKGKDWQQDEDPSTNTAALLKLHVTGDKRTRRFIDALLEYRAYEKLRGTYVKNLDYVKEDWSWAGLGTLAVLHTIYKLHVIPSGRVSTAPAVQNWPERGKANMRKMITSPPGYVMVGADFDQLELRLYAIIAQDVMLLEAFMSSDEYGPIDVHCYNYAALEARTRDDIGPIYKRLMAKGGKEDKGVKQLRNIAKRFVYLETYGGEADKLYMVMSTERDKASGKLMFPDVTEDDVKRWHDNWHTWHPETKRWQESCRRTFDRYGYTASILDFRKRFHPGGINKQNAIANHVIQASGAALANRAILRIADAIPHRGWGPFAGLTLQVHDSITAYVPESRADEAARIIEDSMAYVYEGMPFTAKAKASKCWADQ